MSPDEEAKESDGEDGEDHRAIAEDRFSGKRRENVRSQTHARQDGYIDFRVAEEPEQMLPQDRRAARMRLYDILDVKPCGNKETRPGISIQKEKYATGKQYRKRQKREHGGREPGPARERHAHQRHAFGAQVQKRRDEIERS